MAREVLKDLSPDWGFDTNDMNRTECAAACQAGSLMRIEDTLTRIADSLAKMARTPAEAAAIEANNAAEEREQQNWNRIMEKCDAISRAFLEHERAGTHLSSDHRCVLVYMAREAIKLDPDHVFDRAGWMNALRIYQRTGSGKGPVFAVKFEALLDEVFPPTA